MNVVAAFNDNTKHELRILATVGSYIANFAGLGREKQVKPQDLIPEAFDASKRTPSQEWLEKQYERHEARLERERARKSDGNTRRTEGQNNG